MIEREDGQKPRALDTSNRDARHAVEATLALFNGWRLDLAKFQTVSERRFSDGDRDRMLTRCSTIERELLEARTVLLARLADAPQKVAGHSRVVDVERALDNIETALAQVRAKLGK